MELWWAPNGVFIGSQLAYIFWNLSKVELIVVKAVQLQLLSHINYRFTKVLSAKRSLFEVCPRDF